MRNTNYCKILMRASERREDRIGRERDWRRGLIMNWLLGNGPCAHLIPHGNSHTYKYINCIDLLSLLFVRLKNCSILSNFALILEWLLLVINTKSRTHFHVVLSAIVLIKRIFVEPVSENKYLKICFLFL